VCADLKVTSGAQQNTLSMQSKPTILEDMVSDGLHLKGDLLCLLQSFSTCAH